MNRRGRVLILIGVVVFLVMLVLSLRPSSSIMALIGNAEWTFYDWHLRASAHSKPLTTDETSVVIVGMEDDTPENFYDDFLIDDPTYPLPRILHASVINRLQKAGALVIGLDLLLTEARGEQDKPFVEAIARHGLVLAATRPLPRTDGIETFLEVPKNFAKYLVLGSVEVPRSLGRSVRFVPAMVQDNARFDRHVPHLGIALAAAQRGFLRRPSQITGREFLWGTLHLPVSETLGGDASDTLIHYVGGEGSFPYKSYEDVYWGEVPDSFFKGKIVLIGRYSRRDGGGEDRHMTPLDEMPGVEILANIAHMASTGSGIRTTESWSLWIGLALAVLFLSAVWRLTILPALLLAVVMSGGWIFLAHLVFLSASLWLEVATPLTQLGLVVVLATLYETWRVRRAFEKMISPSATRSAVSAQELRLGTKEVFVTVVFCDIRGFTPYCETHSPEEIEALLQAYFDAGDRAAQRLGSEVDKFMGDAIMLYFFERSGQEPGAVRAVRWAQEMLKAAAKQEITVGIGIASGMAREGFVGTKGRMQRTVIGDVVNLASRLQEATKTMNTPILLSEGSFSQFTESEEVEPLGEITVRGKQMPVAVYRPIFK